MRVGVGYSENPDTTVAGVEASQAVLAQAARSDPCDFVLMFATSRHDPKVLRSAVASVLGESTRIIGGGAVGVITNRHFGYAGDQIGLAAFWLDGVQCGMFFEGGLDGDEKEVGKRLGRRLGEYGIAPDNQPLMFYDAIDRSHGGMRLVMATSMLAGMEEALGFLPGVIGAGLQGDYTCTPTMQWTDCGIDKHQAIALAFSREVGIDTVVLHGCQPLTGYYTVTKADKQTILEINGRPALQFVQELIGPAISPEAFAFFLIFGINKGDKWGEFDEEKYANRLCLAIDKPRNGIVMFEPDMQAGTVFQIMQRSLDLDYVAPKLQNAFSALAGRRPVFAFYINCAGRAAGYGGTDLEDAITVQQVVSDRVPLLGIYSGVEIAPVMGRSRALDWTGVFCLLSVPE